MINGSIRTMVVLVVGLALLTGVVPAVAQTVLMEDNFGNSDIDGRYRVRWNNCSQDSAGSILWYNATGACGNGYAYRQHDGDRCMIRRDNINVSGYTNLKLTFWYRNNSGTSIEAFSRRVNLDGDFVSLGTVGAAGSWTKKEYNLPDYNGEIRIRFDLKGSDTRRIDCISVTGTLACPTPYAGPVSPSSTTVCPGTNVTFSLPNASGGDPNLQYAWWRDDSVQVGSGSTLTTSTPGKYTCAVRNSCNATWVASTSPGYLYNHTLPAITGHPSNQTKCVGQTATFSVTASGSPAPTYQWQVNSGTGWGNISGATSASYTTPTLVAGDHGKQYRCIATNTCGSATSNAATLTVNPLPTITSHPSNQTACEDATATFSVGASDATGYQWQKNESNIGGATSSSYTTPTLTLGDNGNQYRCVVSNACGSVTSNAGTLTVNPLPVAPDSASNDGPICAGASATLTASGGSGTTLRWMTGSCGGTSVGTGNDLSVSPAETTTYYVRWENDCGESTCVSTEVTVVQPPTAPESASANPATIESGQSSTLSYVGGSGGELKWYSGSCGGDYIDSGQGISVSPTKTTTYYCRWENPPCAPSACAEVTVTVSVTEPLPIGEAKKDADGDPVSLSDKLVTAVFSDHFYVGEFDRSSGIRVVIAPMPAGLAVGKSVNVQGTLATTSDGERVVEADTVDVSDPEDTPDPLVAITNKVLGGGDFFYNEATGAGQMGVEDGVGTNNIGLLVKTTGAVTVVGEDFFYIDDGTNAKDFSLFRGIRVRCDALDKPESGDYVSVIGISSIMKVEDRVFRSIRPRVGNDIQSVSPPDP